MNKKHCAIKIVPEISNVYALVDISVSGLQKNQKVVIRATSEDYYCINAGISEVSKGSIWEAYGTFITDNNGNIDLKNTTPIDGTYRSCDQMGMFYSMEVKELHQNKPPRKLKDVEENRNYNVLFTVEIDGKVVSSKNHTRFFCDETIKSLESYAKSCIDAWERT